MSFRVSWILLRFTATFLILYSPVIAQQSGVLLAYREQTDIGYDYKTMWIIFSPNEAKVAAIVPDVIVPRTTGFWRIGKTILCSYGSADRWGGTQEILWQTPLEKVPVTVHGTPCKDQPLGGDRETGGSSTLEPTDPNVNLCGRETTKLLFVSPTAVSEEFIAAQDGCDGRGDKYLTRNDVRTLDDESPVNLTDLFGDRAANAYGLAAEKGFTENSKEWNCPEPDPERYDLKSWAIAHVQGEWRPIASLNEYTGGCAFKHPMDLSLPKRVTGEALKTGLWSTLAAEIPHLSDFYLSPLGDYALVLISPKYAEEYHLYAYSAKNGVLGKRLMEFPWENYYTHSIVMAQWSSGKYVQQWTAAIKKIKDHPLPSPVVPTEEKSVQIKD